MTQLILYTSEDGQSQVQLRADRDTVWLTQLEMAELFSTSKQSISLHLKNIYWDLELDSAATVKDSLTVQTEDGRENIAQIIVANGFPLSAGTGSVCHAHMERHITPLFPDYEQCRKSREAQVADAQVEAELKALENRIKDRKEATL